MSYAVSITQDGTVLNTAGKYVTEDIVVGMSDSIKKAAATYTPGTTDQTIAAGQYLSGAQTVKGDANLVAGNIRSGKSIFGVAGSLTPGITPSGTKSITANGTYDVTEYASAAVAVPVGSLRSKVFDVTISTDVTTYKNVVIATDPSIAQHYADDTLHALFVNNTGFENKTSIQMITQSNVFMASYAGTGLRSSSESVASFGVQHALYHSPSSSTINSLYVNADGEIGYTVSASYPLRSGSYTLVISW